ncbi:MAG TPA: aminopeptidase [Thermoplasmata archaeon]|nr:aminopeptidase [Thermoplasmata archaeon]
MMTLLDGARTAVSTCLGVKRGEHALVLTDIVKREIGEALFEAMVEQGAEAMLLVMRPRTRHGEEPPDPVAATMKEVDVIVAPTEYSISHTQARKKATDAGARIATMPTITTEMMSEGGMTADFHEVRRLVRRTHRKASRLREVTITTDLGTDLTLKLGRRKWIEDTGLLRRRGDFGNLPAGEIFIAPLEGKANGTLVVDGSFSSIGTLDRPITIKVVDGFAERISGGNSARKLRALLKKQEANVEDPMLPYNIAEFGIGLNPNARIIGNPLEDEKVMGTIHIALGDNSTFGGRIRAGIHLDGIITSPTVTGGDLTLMLNGEIR